MVKLLFSRRDFSKFILVSAPWKTTRAGLRRLASLSTIFLLIVFVVFCNQVAMVLSLDGMPLQGIVHHNASSSALNSTSSSVPLGSTTVTPSYPTKADFRRTFLIAIATLSVCFSFFGFLAHTLFLRELITRVRYDLTTGSLISPTLAADSLRRCRWTVLLSGLLYSFSCPLVLSYAADYEDFGWKLITGLVFLDNAMIGLFLYLVLWWHAWSGPQALN